MSIALRPEVAAVLVVELQNDVVSESRAGEPGLGGGLAAAVARRGVLPRTARLLGAARAAGVPVAYVNVANKPGFPRPRARIYAIAAKRGPMLVEGTPGAETHALVAPEAGDHVFTRTCSMDGSFGTGLFAVLHHLRREQVVVLGVSTTLAVEGMVRASLNRGFECFVVEDCCAGLPQEWHDWSIANTLPLMATIATAAQVEDAFGAGVRAPA
ncbi:MAG: cysteine hydrolase family protein [Alphaproteobacteria bacterium]